MKKRTISLLTLCALCLGLFGCAYLQHTQQQLASRLVRLHVVANSDSEADQEWKLRVRDAVLAAAQPCLANAADPVTALAAALPTLQTTAVQTLRGLGCDAPVSVSLQYERFPTRAYSTFSLPAGVYRTLRVTIGAGAGHNWWCVVFPSLCTAACLDELQTAAASAGFTGSELQLITSDAPAYRIGFKTLELLSRLKSLFR